MRLDSDYKIEKFKGDDYHNWKFHMKMYLVDQDLWDVVSKKEDDTSVIKDEEKKNLKSLAKISLCVHKSQLHHIRKAKNGREAWNILKERFEQPSAAHKLFLKKKLYSTQMEENEKMEIFIKNMTEIAEQLEGIGAAVPETELSLVIIGSLPDSYENLRTTLLSMKEETLTMATVSLRLTQEENMRNSKAQENETAESKLLLQKSQEKREQTTNNGLQVCQGCNKMAKHKLENCYVLLKKIEAKQKDSPKVNFSKEDTSDENKSEEFLWYFDSGASSHMCCSLEYFEDFTPHKEKIILGNNTFLTATGIGTVKLRYKNNDFLLKDTLFVPALKKNLISIAKISKLNCNVIFTSDSCKIQKGKLSLEIPKYQNLYVLKIKPKNQINFHRNEKASLDNTLLWHKRMGHCNFKYLSKSNITKVKEVEKNIQCKVCVTGKFAKKPRSKIRTRTITKLFELVHFDIAGPIRKTSIGGSRYFLIFVEDMSKYCWTYPLKRKNDAARKIKEFVYMCENQFNCKLKVVRSDNAKEFINQDVSIFFSNRGIIHESSAPYVPSQNGTAERNIRTISEKATCLLIEAKLPIQYWAEAISTATYLFNRTYVESIKMSPYQKLFKQEPNIKHLKIFGSVCYSKILTHVSKFDPKGLECILIGYSENQKAYRLLHIETGKLIVSVDVVFFEDLRISDIKQRNSSEEEEDNFVSLDMFETNSEDVEENNDNLNNQQSDVLPNDSTEDQEQSQNIDNPIYQRTGESSADQTIQSTTAGKSAITNIEQQAISKPAVTTNVIMTRSKTKTVNNSTSNTSSTQKTKCTSSKTKPNNTSSTPKPSNNSSKTKPNSTSSTPKTNNKRNSSTSFTPNSTPKQIKKVTLKMPETLNITTQFVEPNNYTEAMKSQDSQQWKLAIEKELNSLKENQVYEEVACPKGRKPIGSKWIFKIKTKADGTLDKYKARFVAKGYSQKYNIDYTETFAPVASPTNLRMLIAISTQRNYHMEQLDISTAFLYATLDEEIYILPPEGIPLKDPKNVWRLKRGLYGLKQSPKQWYETLSKTIVQLGFEKAKTESCLFVNPKGLYILVYVDDIIIAGSSLKEINNVKEELSKKFKIQDHGRLNYFLGFEIEHNMKNGICKMHQQKYIYELLETYNMLNCRTVSTPIESQNPPADDKEITEQNEDTSFYLKNYRQIVGSLMYLMTGTRPDLAFTMSVLSRNLENPTPFHAKILIRTLRYLSKTRTTSLIFKKKEKLEVETFCDADWAGSYKDSKSTSGIVTLVNGTAVSWKSCRQSCVALSSCEAELIAIASATQEILYLNSLLNVYKINQMITLFNDNLSAIALIDNQKATQRTRHIMIKYNFVKDSIDNNQLILRYKSTNEMTADLLTKCLQKNKHESFAKLIGLSIAGEC